MALFCRSHDQSSISSLVFPVQKEFRFGRSAEILAYCMQVAKYVV